MVTSRSMWSHDYPRVDKEGMNSPSAAICGRCHGGLREGGWLAYGHWLMRVSHGAPCAPVTTWR